MSKLHLRPGAGVVLFDGAGHVLLMRRQGEGTWGLPGGAIEPGETWAAAALRECREETGWRARIDGLLGIYSDPSTQVYRYPDGEIAHFISVIFLATAIEQAGLPDGDEASELRWATAEALPAPLFVADIPILRDALDRTVQRPVVG